MISFWLCWVSVAACGLWSTGRAVPRHVLLDQGWTLCPVLASRFLTTGSPGKSLQYGINYALLHCRHFLCNWKFVLSDTVTQVSSVHRAHCSDQAGSTSHRWTDGERAAGEAVSATHGHLVRYIHKTNISRVNRLIFSASFSAEHKICSMALLDNKLKMEGVDSDSWRRRTTTPICSFPCSHPKTDAWLSTVNRS